MWHSYHNFYINVRINKCVVQNTHFRKLEYHSVKNKILILHQHVFYLINNIDPYFTYNDTHHTNYLFSVTNVSVQFVVINLRIIMSFLYLTYTIKVYEC